MLSGCLGTWGCSDDAATCVAVDESCSPLYQPVFKEVFERTLVPRCGVDGVACHSREGAQGGLIFEDADESYRLLVDEGRVLAEDPGCSLLVRRLNGAGGGFMPPGAPLEEAERCAIETWVANGAQR